MKESHNTTNWFACHRGCSGLVFRPFSPDLVLLQATLLDTSYSVYQKSAILWSEIIDKLCKTLIKHSLKVTFWATQYLIECHTVFARSCLRRDFSLCSGGVVFIFQIDSVSTRCTVRDSSQIYFDSIIKSMEAFGKPLVENTWSVREPELTRNLTLKNAKKRSRWITHLFFGFLSSQYLQEQRNHIMKHRLIMVTGNNYRLFMVNLANHLF